MEIQPVTEYDTAEILSLIREHFPYTDISFERLVGRIRQSSFLFHKTMENENLTGYAEWQILNRTEGLVQLNGIVVKPWHQGKGHGKALVHAGEEWAAQKGFSKIRLLVANSNNTAKSLYRSAGYSFKKMHPKKIGGERAEVWEKPINRKGSASYS